MKKCPMPTVSKILLALIAFALLAMLYIALQGGIPKEAKDGSDLGGGISHPTEKPIPVEPDGGIGDGAAPLDEVLSEPEEATILPANEVVITHANGSFSPNTVTIKKGTRVTFVNSEGAAMWVASDLHPTHTDFDGTNKSEHCAAGYTGPAPFDQCSSGDNFSFTFDKAGTWAYHNHLRASEIGTIIVQ